MNEGGSGVAGPHAQNFASERPNVFSLRFSGLAVLSYIVRHRLAFSQNVSILQRRDMNENVRAACIRRNETEAFVGIKKLNLARRHIDPRLFAALCL